MNDRSSRTPADFARSLTRVMAQIERQRRGFMCERLGEMGLRGLMYSFLLLLDSHPDVSQDEMAQLLCVDKSSVARMSRALDDMEYIDREALDDNRRRNKLLLTQKGRDILPKIRSLFSEWSAALTAGLSDEERQTAVELLTRMIKNFD